MNKFVLFVSITLMIVFCFKLVTPASLVFEVTGNMEQFEKGSPLTSFSLSKKGTTGYVSVTTVKDESHVIFQGVGSVTCLVQWNKTTTGAKTTYKLIVGGELSLGVVKIPQKSKTATIVSINNNKYIGAIYVIVQKNKIVNVTRSNFPSQWESCVGGSTPKPGKGGLSAKFPNGDMDKCSKIDFTKVDYVSCTDVVSNINEWSSKYLAADRGLEDIGVAQLNGMKGTGFF